MMMDSSKLFAGSMNSTGRVTPDEGPFKRKRGRPPLHLTGERLDMWRDPNLNIVYSIGDQVYFGGKKIGDSYRIGSIQALRLGKKDQVIVGVKLFFSSCELPEAVYQRLMADRNDDNWGGIGEFLSAKPQVRAREVFRCDKSEIIRADSLRGKCCVLQYADPQSARRFVPDPDTYFTILGYNPDTRRLATIQGEIRIGQSHQAKLPECNPDVAVVDRVSRIANVGTDGGDYGEQQVWRPEAVSLTDLQNYLTAARSMVASFASMCDRQSPDESAESAKRDENTQLALDNLHKYDYDKNLSLQELVKCTPLVRSVDRRWDEEDAKKFMKGLRMFGKNFFKIRKEFLPEKDTKELVEYYYYWKKTPVATSSKSAGRRRQRKQASSKTTSTGEGSSESEEADGIEAYVCFRCDADRKSFSSDSGQWHYVEDHGYVCDTCKLNYSKYRDQDGQRIPEYLFRPVNPALNYRRQRSRPSRSPDIVDESVNQDRESPCSSTSSNGSVKSPKKHTLPRKTKQPSSYSDSETPQKKKKTEEEASPDSLQSEVGRHDAEEDNGNLGDVENNQDDASVGSPLSHGSSDDGYKPDPNRRSPTPIHCQESFPPSKNAHFIRCLKRVDNSCSRVDIHYIPPPNSKMALRREESNAKAKPQPFLSEPGVISTSAQPALADLRSVKSEPLERSHVHQRPTTNLRITSPHINNHHKIAPAHTPAHASMSAYPSQRMTPGHRMTPRSQHGEPHQFLTPSALSQLSQMAGRPNQQQASEEMSRQMAFHAAAAGSPHPMGAGGPPGFADPVMLSYYRMMTSMYPAEYIERMYPQDVRERLDMMLKAQDVEMHREKMMMAMAASQGMDSKGMLEAQMMEMQRKLGPMMPGMLPPGFIPPTSIASGMSGMSPHELMARERAEKEQKEHLQKLGFLHGLPEQMAAMGNPAERLSAERLQAERLAGMQVPAAHAHTHTHTHLHLYQQAAAFAAAAAANNNPFMAQQLLQGMGAGGAPDPATLARGGFPPFMQNPAYPGAPNIPTSAANAMREDFAMFGARPDMDPRELLIAQQMLAASNPAFAAAMAAQQENAMAAQHRQMMIERERERQLPHH